MTTMTEPRARKPRASHKAVTPVIMTETTKPAAEAEQPQVETNQVTTEEAPASTRATPKRTSQKERRRLQAEAAQATTSTEVPAQPSRKVRKGGAEEKAAIAATAPSTDKVDTTALKTWAKNGGGNVPVPTKKKPAGRRMYRGHVRVAMFADKARETFTLFALMVTAPQIFHLTPHMRRLAGGMREAVAKVLEYLAQAQREQRLVPQIHMQWAMGTVDGAYSLYHRKAVAELVGTPARMITSFKLIDEQARPVFTAHEAEMQRLAERFHSALGVDSLDGEKPSKPFTLAELKAAVEAFKPYYALLEEARKQAKIVVEEAERQNELVEQGEVGDELNELLAQMAELADEFEV